MDVVNQMLIPFRDVGLEEANRLLAVGGDERGFVRWWNVEEEEVSSWGGT